MPTREERIEASRTVSEARAEREAIQAVEREADEEWRRREEAARPKVFAPPPPDFPRTKPSPTAAEVDSAKPEVRGSTAAEPDQLRFGWREER